LIHQGFKYQKNIIRRHIIYWRCWKKECRAPLKANLFDLEDQIANSNVLSEPEHTHAHEDVQITRSEIKNRLVQKVKQDPSLPIKRIYYYVVREHGQGEGDAESIPPFSYVRSAMTRARQELVPNIPWEVGDVEIESTWAGDYFLLHQDNDWGILLFATPENLEGLSRCTDVYMDGTFRTCPHPYSQFFTVHGKYRNRVIVFVSCLVTGKNIGQYRQILQTLKLKIRQLTGHRWLPVRVICDFEQSLITAIQTDLPRVHLSGCYFHFTQALWRNVQSLGLARPYRQRLRKCIRKVMAIGYLPLLLVRQNFNIHRNANSTRRLVRRFPALNDFLNYVQRNYLDGNFSPAMLNVFERDMDNRSNNFVESKYLNICGK
jgi:hypothetical protein